MKARFYPVVLSLACGLSPLPAVHAADPAPLPYAFVDPGEAEVAELRRSGERVIDHAGNALLLELRRELADKTPALAVGAVHLKHYKLPAPVPGKPAVTALKRTSLQLRNPANTPDAADLAALEMIQRQIEQGDPVSPLLMQKVALPGQPVEWRLYRPLVVLNQCIACHGPTNSLAPGVAETLQVFYPADRATRYRAGEWRGLLRVSIAAPAAGQP
jgi:hypothetical protein